MCNHHGLSVDDDKTDEDAEFIPLEDSDDEKEVAVDDEEDIEVFQERELITTQMMMEPQLMKM